MILLKIQNYIYFVKRVSAYYIKSTDQQKNIMMFNNCIVLFVLFEVYSY